MKNIIIVTGGCGFVGKNLIEFLIQKTKFKGKKSFRKFSFKIKKIRSVIRTRGNSNTSLYSWKRKWI